MFVLEWFYNARNFILTTFCSFLVTQSSHSICDDVEEANALPSRLAGIRGSPELIKALLKKHFIKNVERQQNYQTCENKRLIWKGRKHIANYKAVTCFFFQPKYQSQRLLPSFLYRKLLTMLIVQHHLGVLCNPQLTLNFTSTYSQTKRKAEILWALKCVESDRSANSAIQISNVFVKLFPNSQIASNF